MTQPVDFETESLNKEFELIDIFSWSYILQL